MRFRGHSAKVVESLLLLNDNLNKVDLALNDVSLSLFVFQFVAFSATPTWRGDSRPPAMSSRGSRLASPNTTTVSENENEQALARVLRVGARCGTLRSQSK